MAGATKQQKRITFGDLPFSQLIKRDQRLAELRQEYVDQKDFERAAELYASASAIFPRSTALLGGLGYCLVKLKRLGESVAVQRRALALDPDNHRLLNDLGWALTESGQFHEAEAVLQKAVDLSPPEYHLAKNNLKHARRLTPPADR